MKNKTDIFSRQNISEKTFKSVVYIGILMLHSGFLNIVRT